MRRMSSFSISRRPVDVGVASGKRSAPDTARLLTSGGDGRLAVLFFAMRIAWSSAVAVVRITNCGDRPGSTGLGSPARFGTRRPATNSLLQPHDLLDVRVGEAEGADQLLLADLAGLALDHDDGVFRPGEDDVHPAGLEIGAGRVEDVPILDQADADGADADRERARRSWLTAQEAPMRPRMSPSFSWS